MRTSSNKPNAFVLAGLLTRVAIIIAGSAVAAVTVVPGLRDARRMECRYNMITIGNLMRVHRVKNSEHAYVTSVADLKNEIPPTPHCPDGGVYRITISDGTAIGQNGRAVPAGEPIISCSSPSHGKYALDIDID